MTTLTFDTADQLIAALLETKARTLAYFELPEEKMHLTYGEGKRYYTTSRMQRQFSMNGSDDH